MELALLIVNTVLLLVVLAVLVVMLLRLNQAWRMFEARQEQFEHSLDTLAQLTEALDSLMRTFGDLRDRTQWAGDLGRALGRWRKGS